MCGIFGWVGKDPKDFNRRKFDILGILNESRGTHSCGVSFDGRLFKGHDGNKFNVYTRFIGNITIPQRPDSIPIVLGHTRHATGNTSHSEKNAHPFRFKLNSKHHAVAVHNGVIKNYRELAEQYNVDPTNKIDSEVLLEILANFKNKSDFPKNHNNNDNVLVDYVGAAAIMIYNSKEPDTLWVFRGESINNNRGEVVEERPLHFYQESENSMYISSEPTPLFAIIDDPEKARETKDKVYSFSTNTLYCIKGGKITEKISVDRSTSSFRDEVTRDFFLRKSRNNQNNVEQTTTGDSSNLNSRHSYRNNDSKNTAVDAQTDLVNAYADHDMPSFKAVEYKDNNIFYESVIFNKLPTNIYMENFRYKRNGHLITGVYIFIKEEGFVRAGDNRENAQSRLKDFVHHVKKTGERVKFGDISKSARLFYIYEGILIKNEDSFNLIMTMEASRNRMSYEALTTRSVYPIINWEKWSSAHKPVKGSQKVKIYPQLQEISLDGGMYSGIFSPIGSFRTYEVEYGNLKDSTTESVMNLPEKYEMISINSNAEFEEDSEEETAIFDDNIVNELKSHGLDDSYKIIGIKNDYQHIIESVGQRLNNMKKTSVVNKLIEFNESNSSKMIPIEKMVNELEKELLTT